MKITVESDSYNQAIDTIINLIGTEADCILTVEDSKASLETSNLESWLRLPLKLTKAEGGGKIFTKVEFLRVVNPKTKTMTMTYDGSDHVEVEMGRTRGAIRVLHEDDIEVEEPEVPIKVSSIMPVKLLKFATGAVIFKPLLDASSPNVILEVESGELSLSSYDTYVGTSYAVRNEEVKAKGNFKVVIGLDYWKLVTGRLGIDGVVKIGANDKSFRIKTPTFDLYHAVVQAERLQNVRDVISKFLAEDSLAVVEFDGKAVTDAIEAAKGIIKQGNKDEARFIITLKDGIAILSAESSAGEIESEFDISGFDSDEDLEFRANSVTFADTLKLTRDEGLKYGPVRLTVLDGHLVMESLKVPASSIAPTLQD